ncbi:hypothetical protein [uncultured Thiodictyon sp.]|uniref:hypothetical protein n=1 Tax=uncultured Thiodictyon sp. TaxID=1846217 RepID=UPI0025EA1067|nr:hypothetical protein [uncultured Thiodictyon sp.]
MKTSYAIGVSALLLMGVAAQTRAADDKVPYMVRCAEHRTCWNAGAKFQPVPAELQAKGDRICQTDKKYSKDTWQYAIGWHPDAKDIDGKKMRGGGFDCGDKRKKADSLGPN